jgi:hypothetical protein
VGSFGKAVFADYKPQVAVGMEALSVKRQGASKRRPAGNIDVRGFPRADKIARNHGSIGLLI